jgi:outer membrane protein, heavy metal efflux system
MKLACVLLAGGSLLCAQQQLKLPEVRPLDNRLSLQTQPRLEGALALEEVLLSVDKHYQPLRAALLDRAVADADLLSAEGRFDFSLKARYDNNALGFYRNNRIDFSVEQPTTVQGLSWYAGYDVSRGRYASYDGKLSTDQLGEVRAGLRLPLLRDRAIDTRRAELQKAQFGLRVADLGIAQQRLLIIQAATRRYWDWVAAGRRLAIASSLLELADQREKILEDSVALGALPQFEVLDNKRIILQRKNAQVEATRALENAAIELSLFYRDGAGVPRLAEARQLPPGFPDPTTLTPEQMERDILLALERRPELMRLIFQRRQLNVDEQLARNALLPNVDLFTEYNRLAGNRQVLRGPDEWRTGIVFDLPFQRRAARGRTANVEARTRQITEREGFLRDQITAEVRDAVSAVRNSFLRSDVLRDEVQATREVEGAERARYELGDSTLFVLNQRELATADAALREVSALNEYFRAYANYELAVAQALATPKVP